MAQSGDELSFGEGDVMLVTDTKDSAWWEGELNGVHGCFPTNYVERM